LASTGATFGTQNNGQITQAVDTGLPYDMIRRFSRRHACTWPDARCGGRETSRRGYTIC